VPVKATRSRCSTVASSRVPEVAVRLLTLCDEDVATLRLVLLSVSAVSWQEEAEEAWGRRILGRRGRDCGISA